MIVKNHRKLLWKPFLKDFRDNRSSVLLSEVVVMNRDLAALSDSRQLITTENLLGSGSV